MNADKSVIPDSLTEEERLNGITERIIGCAFTVLNTIGCGFLEKVYENALAHEIRKSGMLVEQQKPLEVWYDGIVVGVYIADLWVENLVPVELKAVKTIDDIHLAQSLNQLKAGKMKAGLVLNFGSTKLGVRRMVNDF